MNAWPMYMRCAVRQWRGLPQGVRVNLVNDMRAGDIMNVSLALRELRESDLELAELEAHIGALTERVATLGKEASSSP